MATWVSAALLACGSVCLPASAQEASPALTADAPAPLAPLAPEEPPDPGVAVRFLRDVGGDYVHFFSKETALWLGAGGGAALGVHQADQAIADSVASNHPSLPGGNLYGSQLLHVPVAVAWWIAGSAAGSQSQAEAGRDLLRAQISVFSWTYGIKFAVNRTRPNGDPRSFPSGHASTTFATAMILQDHFGWKAGLPAFAMAAYTAASRVADNQHWASDVVFGAALGVASARTVTIHMRNTRVSISPMPVPGGAAITLTAMR